MVNNFLEWWEIDSLGRCSSTIDSKFYVDVDRRSERSAIAIVVAFNGTQLDVVESVLGVSATGLTLAEFRELYKMTRTRERETKLRTVVANLKESN